MNPIHIRVENPDELLNAGAFGAGALIRVESSPTGRGTGFVEKGTLPIVSATYAYVYYDTLGTTGTYYRVRYSNSGGTNFSDYGAELQGGIDSGLCSLAEVRARLGETGVDTERDSILQSYIDAITTDIHGFTSRRFLPLNGATFAFDADSARERGRVLPIKIGIRAVTSLQVRYVSNGAQVTVDPKFYRLQPCEIELEYGWPFTHLEMIDLSPYRFNLAAYEATEISGDFGWATCPADIHEIALAAVTRRYRGRQSGQSEMIGPTEFGQMSTTWDFRASEFRKLDWYRHRGYG